jgi:transcription elongation factor GreA
MKKLFYLTQSGVDELRGEQTHLLTQRAPIAERLQAARAQGDLAENAEYIATREEQERTEGRIAEIEHILMNVDIIKKPRGDTKVQLGSTVTLKNSTTKVFQVVGTVEADPMNGKISDESPLGMAVLGKSVGDKVEIKANADSNTYKIIKIS